MALFRPTYRRNGVLHRSPFWRFEYRIDGRRCSVNTRETNKRKAQTVAQRILDAAERGEAAAFFTASTHTDALVEEYLNELRRRGRSEMHVTSTRSRLRCVLDGAEDLDVVQPEFIRTALARLADERKLSGKTLNDYRKSLGAFFSWLELEGRWHTNPVRRVAPVQELEPTRVRRALSNDELCALLESTKQVRSAIYRLAATTGLRRSEIAALTWSDVDLEQRTVTVRAATAKNRKDTVLPMPEGTVAALKDLRPRKPLRPTIFRSVPGPRAFYRDLMRAGIQKTDSFEGVDFHALRTTFATALARAEVPLVLAQRLLRHSDPKLTANVYTKLDLEDARRAVHKLPVKKGAPRTHEEHPTRRAILDLLKDRELPGHEIADLVGVGRSTVSHHLAGLLKNGLVRWRAHGVFRFYSAVPAALGR